MNQAYNQSSTPHDMHRGSLPSIHEAYRGPMASVPQYGMQQVAPIAPHNQLSYDPFMNPRPVPSNPLQPGDSLRPLAQGPGPQSEVPPPPPVSKILGNRRYELKVEQQPVRARMCGFGDKDRRPITPPPCVQLIITDITTGKEVDMNDIDYGMFVLNVDLWDETGRHEVNLVRHSSSSPGISSTTPASYAQEAPGMYSHIAPQQHQGGYNPYPGPAQVNPCSNGQQYNNSNYSGYQLSSSYAPQGYGQAPSYYNQAPGHASEYGQQQIPYGGRPYGSQDLTAQRPSVSSTAPSGMFTRNLIGSLAASAFRLTNCTDQIGIWFVLQDLSVRTEGDFTLRFSFVNVGIPQEPRAPGKQSVMQVNAGRAPVLATAYSKKFTVFSAKRFPGVVESTALSKMFATQGIKIPIRKDGTGKVNKRELEEDNDDEGDE